MTNRKKTGELFRNLVGIKPVLDSQNQFVYVIGLHYDVSREFEVNRKISLVEELLELLPTSIITDDDHIEFPTTF
jgi:hypothetical protein